MKRFILLILFLPYCVLAQTEGSFQAIFKNVPENQTTVSLSAGADFLPVSYQLNPAFIPFHDQTGYSNVLFTVEFYLADINNPQNRYFLSSENYQSEGANGLAGQYWSVTGTAQRNLPVPCSVPSGTYHLVLRVTDIQSYAGFEASDVFIRISDITSGSTSECSYLPSGNGFPAGIYNPCELSALTTVNVNNIPNALSGITFSSTTSNCAQNNGSATALPTGGSGNYTYSWSNQQSGQTASGLSAGNYSVTITDNNSGCSVSEDILIENAYTLDFDFTETQSCAYDEGYVGVNVLNGQAPFQYNWNSGHTVALIEQAAPGNYVIDITDANGCVASGSILHEQALQDYHFDYPDGLTISSDGEQIEDIDGDGFIRIRGVLRFTDNVEYDLTDKNLQFARDLEMDIPDLGMTHSGVIVDRGATLNADNCQFSGVDLCDAMWEGIQVWGGNSTVPNGSLTITNSLIRDAHTAISAHRKNLPFGIFQEYGSGNVQSENNEFINNAISFSFMGTGNGSTPVTNTSVVRACTFTCDDLLTDASEYPNSGIICFIRLNRVKGPKFLANTFTGNDNFDPAQRGTGIRSYNAQFTLQSGYVGVVGTGSAPVPNTFVNLTKGVDIYSVGGTTLPIHISDNRFTDVQQGITSNGSNFDEITYNDFFVPAGSSALHSWGINLYNCSGFLTSENMFTTNGTSDYTYGLISRNSVLTGSRHYRNRFTGNFYAATQLEANNGGLQLQCNTYNGENTYDWAITSGSIGNQGTCGASVLGANNYFNDCIPGSDSQIFAAANVPLFYYRTSSLNQPTCVSTNVVSVTCPYVASYESDCQPILDNPCANCGETSLTEMIEEYRDSKDNTRRSILKTFIIRSCVKNGDLNAITEFLEPSSKLEDLELIIPTYIRLARYDDALRKIHFAEQLYPKAELQPYFILANLYKQGLPLSELSTDARMTLKELATGGNVTAQAILTEYDQNDMLRFAEMIPESEKKLSGNGMQESSEFSVYPNPSEGSIFVRFGFQAGQEIRIDDMTGRTQHFEKISKTMPLLQIENLPSGVYLVNILENGRVMRQTKVVITN